jgi:hypothetical protein
VGWFHFISGTATQTYIFLPGYIAVSYCMGSKKSWNVAMAFAALQYLIHPHPGMYTFTTIAVLWFINAYSERKFALSIWKGAIFFIAIALFASLPNLLTDINNFALADDVYKLSLRRWAHHLSPKAYLLHTNGTLFISQTIIFLLAIFLFFCIPPQAKLKLLLIKQKSVHQLSFSQSPFC